MNVTKQLISERIKKTVKKKSEEQKLTQQRSNQDSANLELTAYRKR